MSDPSRRLPTQVNGWSLYGHPCFNTQYNELVGQVEALKQKHPQDYIHKNASKRLAAIQKLIYDVIPQDPTRPEYRQGTTLGDAYKHWFRATFFQQYRLFFRYHEPSKTIVYAWVNDEKTKRAYDSKTDACKVFEKMLNSGNPPDDWNSLVRASE
ncbi:type II toxin-antitoxin system YhaV family toxin [Lacimicrobium alkaliphilum]|uniref:Toxin n=1 Tax=Lacimicrobium alkaliphilum TaxID=1526571 RepID=A0A0U2QJE4_9ALTE|nr:type II toxin-antitoxin system YhaV family toxin [Lacimicrobium alkaliphilum]ALS97163.1 toxin [Lacimicrobium alkaliphilum]